MSAETLTAEADRIAARRNDPRTPAVVRRAIARPCAITLRKFLTLEDTCSPVLTGKWSEEDRMQEARIAFAIIFPDRPPFKGNAIDMVIEEMDRQVDQAFSTIMKMKFPQPAGSAPAPSRADGIGWVGLLWARIVLAGIENPLDMPLDQIFILASAIDFNEGASCVGEDYRDREA